ENPNRRWTEPSRPIRQTPRGTPYGPTHTVTASAAPAGARHSRYSDQPAPAPPRPSPPRPAPPVAAWGGIASSAGSDASSAPMVQARSSGPIRTPGGRARGTAAMPATVAGDDPTRSGMAVVRSPSAWRSTTGTPARTVIDSCDGAVSSEGAPKFPPTATSSGAGRETGRA